MATPETSLRLQSVLDILAEAAPSGSRPSADEVVTEALRRVPPTAHEQEPLSGGVPRGVRSLTTATARLVKAGWITKGRGGWGITPDGLRAATAFADAQDLVRALDNGAALPLAPVTPAPVETQQPLAVVQSLPSGQPSAVALVGDFNVLLGAPRDWDPAAEQAQMTFDATEGLWRLAAELPAGTYAFKFAMERSWHENYGAFGLRDGANHELRHDGGAIDFVYDHMTRDVVVGWRPLHDRELPATA